MTHSLDPVLVCLSPQAATGRTSPDLWESRGKTPRGFPEPMSGVPLLHALPPLATAFLGQPVGSPAHHRLDLKDIPNAVRLVAPDLGILVVSAVCLGLCGRLTRETRQSQCTREPVSCGGQGVCVEEGRSRAAPWLLEDYFTFLTNVEFLVVRVNMCKL